MTLAVAEARPQRATPRLGPGSRALDVLAELHRLTADTGEVTITVTVLATQLDVAERTVQRAIGRLVALDLIEVARPPGRGWRGVPNSYRVVPCASCPVDGRPADDGLCHHVSQLGNAAPSRGEST